MNIPPDETFGHKTPESDMPAGADPAGNGEPGRWAATDGSVTPDGQPRIERAGLGRRVGTPAWNVEMFESPLMDRGIPYTVNDGPAGEDADTPSWIEFQVPTRRYVNANGEHAVTVRLTVVGGRLAITAPDVYPHNSLVRTTEPPPDRDGNLRVMRMGDDDTSQIDLMMAADGQVTAVLRMETILAPFNRSNIVQIAEQFAGGIDLLDFAVCQCRLRLA